MSYIGRAFVPERQPTDPRLTLWQVVGYCVAVLGSAAAWGAAACIFWLG